MGNIDEKRLSAVLERIGNIKAEFEALENEVRGLGEATEVTGPAEAAVAPTSPVTEMTSPVTEPVEVTAASTAQVTEPVVRQDSPTIEATVPTEITSDPTEETPIEIDIQDIDIPPIVEDPAAEYTVASASSATEDIQVTEPTSPVSEPVPPVTEPVEVAVEIKASTDPAVLDDLPFDDDLPTDEPSAIPEPTSAPVSEPVAEPVQEPTLDIEPEIVIKPEPDPKPKAAILDSRKAETAVMDVMAEKQAWRTDRPGSQVKNVISAISLNDRVLLINVLFKEDPLLFQNTISAFNGMTTLDEALSYIQTNFPDWDLNSEPVYRLMMAVRRKLR